MFSKEIKHKLKEVELKKHKKEQGLFTEEIKNKLRETQLQKNKLLSILKKN